MLELGTAKVDITPRFPVPLAGFAFRSGVFDGVVTPLFARIFCFRSRSSAPVILVSADLIWWGSDRMASLRKRIRVVGGENAAIVLHGTHSHSGPQTSEILSPEIGRASPEYLKSLEDTVLRGIEAALAALEPVTVERGLGRCEIGIYRRRLVDGVIQMAPNPAGPNDTECIVIRFRTLSGATKSLLVHFTCHPTTTAANLVSAEFCGAAMTTIEGSLGDNVIAAYLQGCCGDIRPALIRDDQFYRGDAEDVERLGSELSRAVLGVLSGPMQPCESGPCSSGQSELPLFLETLPDHPGVPLEMTKIMLGRDLGLLTFNAEMVLQYGLLVKQRSGGTMLPLAYSNGMIGYVTTQQQLEEGGYESRGAFPYFGMPGPFDASTEGRIEIAIESLLT